MNNLESLLKLVDSEIEAVAKNGKFRSKDEIEAVYKLIDIAKDIYCIWQYEEEMDGEDEMSYANDGYNRGGNRNGGRGMNRMYDGKSYDGGQYDVSYARGRRGNVRRDSMGRYARNGGSSYNGKEDYVEHLRDMMEDAKDEQTRQDIMRLIQKMENA